MKILAIETSCDETAVAVIETTGESDDLSFRVLGNSLLSQALKHRKYGGVYPNLAKREHAKNLLPMLKNALEEASFWKPKVQMSNLKKETIEKLKKILEREPELLKQFADFIPTIEKPDVDIIAVTQGPGLEPALWVGLNFAKALSLVWDIPLVPVNHMEGHVLSVLMTGKINFPAIALLISGGHTELVLVKNWMVYEILGATRDDAVGEAFDKVARLLGLPYPGGPEISRLAEQARKRGEASKWRLPRPMINSEDYDFSFSGLKTAVLYTVQKIGKLTETNKQGLAMEFEDAVVDVLIKKTKKALLEYRVKTLIVGGGVIANKELRKAFTDLARELSNVQLLIPEMSLATDNAVMIGIAGYFRSGKEKIGIKEIAAEGNLKLES